MKIIGTFKNDDRLLARWEFDSADFPPSEAVLKEIIVALQREFHFATTGEILNVRNQ